MKRFVKHYAFCYGCIGATAFFACYICALTRRFDIGNYLENNQLVWSVLVLHAFAMLATFQPGIKWEPVVAITEKRLHIAKVILGLAILNFFLGCFLAKSASLTLTSLLLLNTIYIAIHWAFRPENLFPERFLAFITNPLGWTFAKMRSRDTGDN